ncbi:XRE family transcriptional regulator [Brevibacillus borstelensis]|uniref:helix-turn-helix domain-containing protein n=1 Tax=Brevibacillus TaxID=55080 RepID=UPI000F07F685|nr:helix-turn-helix transcriptional regulator [Brevibacillus borstelensis]MCM3560619.1 helix-turn-helix transcriptional regulator [Brevibacillus borstelensis]MED1885958.1 helix-turn-helix transcriptional regulator [Brevibacillus borstelensis]RNB56088.1 XRE family transcriptional regulator [Brevibacillus borstelensis]GED55769.1 hypothetical protein BBO01nite_50100 [Brevibacillus borstelensis]
MRLCSNLKTLAETKGVSIRAIARDIDYRLESVRLLYNDEMERYPRDLLTKLCTYFQCSISDILIFEDNSVDQVSAEAGQ